MAWSSGAWCYLTGLPATMTAEVAAMTATSPHRQAEQAGRRAAEHWVAHPKTHGIIEANNAALACLVLTDIAPNQLAVTDLALAAASWPGSALWWRPTGPEVGPWTSGWPGLPEDQRASLMGYAGRVRAALVDLAEKLKEAAAPIDPAAATDLVVLAQLALLAIPWERTPAEIVATLNVPAPFAVQRDGRAIANMRRGLSAETGGVAVRLQHLRAANVDPETAKRVDRRGRSAVPTPQTAALLSALAEVIPRYPTYGAKRLIRDWRANAEGSPGRQLREILGEPLGAEPPGQRTLEREIAHIRQ